MKRTLLLPLMACSLLVMQNCGKNQSLSKTKSSVTSRTKSPDWADGDPIVNGVYKFTNPNSNKVIDLPGNAVYTNGTKLQQWDYYLLNTQSWVVTSIGSGYYTIINAVSGKSLDVPGGAATQGLQLQQWDYYALTSQQWAINSIGLGGYKIVNRATGMDVTVDGASTANGAKITETTDGSSCCSSQVWVPQQVAYKEAAATGFFQRTSGITDMDIAISILLPNGNVFWMFGDSGTSPVINGTVQCNGPGVHSAGVLQPNNNWNQASATTILGTGGIALFQINPAPGYLTWPEGGFQNGDTTYVYGLNLLEAGGSGGPNKWCKMVSSPSMQVTGYSTINDAGAAAAGIGFGVHGFVKNTDGYIYAYGSKSPGPLQNSLLFVARFPQSTPYAVWTYWNGSSWVANAASATAVYVQPNGDYSATVCMINGKFVVLSADFSLACDEGTGIESAISSSPTGPFSTPKVIYHVDDLKQGHTPMFYQPVAHPEYINSNNEILITYCINHYNNANTNTCVPTCVQSGTADDPNDYRPRGVRMPLSLIDPSL